MCTFEESLFVWTGEVRDSLTSNLGQIFRIRVFLVFSEVYMWKGGIFVHDFNFDLYGVTTKSVTFLYKRQSLFFVVFKCML